MGVGIQAGINPSSIPIPILCALFLGRFSPQSSRAQRNPTFGPASRTLPQFRVVALASEGGESHPPPRSTWLAPARGDRSETVSAYQSATPIVAIEVRSKTPLPSAPNPKGRFARGRCPNISNKTFPWKPNDLISQKRNQAHAISFRRGASRRAEYYGYLGEVQKDG